MFILCFVRFNISAMGHHEITQMLPTLCGPLECPYIDLHVSFHIFTGSFHWRSFPLPSNECHQDELTFLSRTNQTLAE